MSKLRALLTAQIAAVLCAGCAQNSEPDYFNSGRDARTYNPMTGRYEWPDEPPRRQTAPSSGPARTPPAPAASADDERVYNPQTRQFE